jgi:hypothetical protein
MNAKMILRGLSAVLILVAPVAARAGQDQGLQLALRTGFILPFGYPGDSKQLLTGSFSDNYTGFIPIVAEVGWRIDPNWFVGAVFQYAVGLTTTKGCDPYKTGLYSCSDSDIFLGAEGVYHFKPKTGVDPWAGVGMGYEWLGLSTGTNDRPGYGTTYYKGFQLNLQVGVDFPVAAGFFIAPFLSFALGEYTRIGYFGTRGGTDINNPMFHELLTLGLRASFNL